MKSISQRGYTQHHFLTKGFSQMNLNAASLRKSAAARPPPRPTCLNAIQAGGSAAPSGAGRRGYTMVEILVTIAIITIMTAIFVGSYSFGKNFDTLKAETQRLSAVLRNVRIRDFNGILQFTKICTGGGAPITCNANADCPSSPTQQTCTLSTSMYPPGGFGIHIENNYKVCSGNSNISCTLDADCNTQGTCTSSSNKMNYILFADISNNGLYDGGKTGNEYISEYKLPTGLSIERDANGSPTSIDQLNIIFKGSFISMYDYSGGAWTQLTGSEPSLYVIPSDCSKTQNKKGFVEVSSSTPTINISDQLITPCP